MGPRRRCRGRPSELCFRMNWLDKLSWCHDERVAEDLSRLNPQGWARRSFNGATTKVSWKTLCGFGGMQSVGWASMGPRRRCRGRRWRRRWTDRWGRSFNAEIRDQKFGDIFPDG